MRVRLSQQTTACYGFPLALQLFAFEALPQLLCKIPDGARTATFLEDPTACKDTVTILGVQGILAVEADAVVSSSSLIVDNIFILFIFLLVKGKFQAFLLK